MDQNVALGIFSALADGCEPETGEVFPRKHVLQRPDVIRALGLAVTSLREGTGGQGRVRRTGVAPLATETADT